MHGIKRLTLILMTTLLAIMSVAVPATAAPAGPADVQAQINQLLTAHPGGVQISTTQVAWQHGSVILNLTPQAQTTTAGTVAPDTTKHGCPASWYCFYQDKNFGGRLLQFHDCSTPGTIQLFSNYGFTNETSSWDVNRNLASVTVNNNAPAERLWIEGSDSSSSYVGGAANDRADWFDCFSG
jgi:hypothetical protein